MLSKDNRPKDKKYLKWLREQPSCISGQYGVDCHHIKGHGYTGGVKASDYMTIPLTRTEHTHLHNIGYNAWEEIYGSQINHVVDTLMEAIKQGKLKFHE